jgi:hypothetical protein
MLISISLRPFGQSDDRLTEYQMSLLCLHLMTHSQLCV